jgi:hypothetical protein
MGGAAASAEVCRATAESGSDSHHDVDEREGFREALNPSYGLPDGQISSPLQLWRVQPLLQKYFCFSEMQIRLYD